VPCCDRGEKGRAKLPQGNPRRRRAGQRVGEAGVVVLHAILGDLDLLFICQVGWVKYAIVTPFCPPTPVFKPPLRQMSRLGEKRLHRRTSVVRHRIRSQSNSARTTRRPFFQRQLTVRTRARAISRPITPGAELGDRDGLLGAPVGALRARVLEMEREMTWPAADPQQTGPAVPMLDAVVAQFSGRHDGGLPVVKASRSGKIVDPFPRRSGIVETGQLYVDHRHPSLMKRASLISRITGHTSLRGAGRGRPIGDTIDLIISGHSSQTLPVKGLLRVYKIKGVGATSVWLRAPRGCTSRSSPSARPRR
jgi:hypothetical protein